MRECPNPVVSRIWAALVVVALAVSAVNGSWVLSLMLGLTAFDALARVSLIYCLTDTELKITMAWSRRRIRLDSVRLFEPLTTSRQAWVIDGVWQGKGGRLAFTPSDRMVAAIRTSISPGA